jgi:hypothetical protein
MSLLFIDGFDHYTDIRLKWQVVSSLEMPTYVAGRFGGNAIKKQFQNGAGTNTTSFGIQDEIFIGIAYFPPGFPGVTESMWRILDLAGATICSVNITSAGILSINAGGQSDSAVTPLPTSQWSYIEIHYTAKNTGGIAELRVDEAVVATVTGDTTVAAIDDIAGFQILDDGTNSPRYLLDDLYILNAEGTSNNGYLGDVRITTMAANADGSLNDWTPSDSLFDNFEMVDEVLVDGATYVESGLIGASEDYNNDSFAERSITPGIIFGVQCSNATLRTDAGTIRHKNELIVAGARFSDDIEYVAGAGDYFIDTYVRDTDPSDDGTWTEAKVAAVGSGITITFKEI